MEAAGAPLIADANALISWKQPQQPFEAVNKKKKKKKQESVKVSPRGLARTPLARWMC